MLPPRGTGCKMGGAMRSVQVEEWRVFGLTDCVPPPAPCSRSFPDAVLEDHPEAAKWFPDGQFHTRFGITLLRSRHGHLLVDCGIGPDGSSYFPELRGNLAKALRAAGSSLDRIRHVVFTHLHVDHVGWATMLPSASFYVGAAEWTHWAVLGDAAGLPHHTEAVARCIQPLADARRLEIMPEWLTPLPGIKLLPAYGHTPGHCAVLVRDRLLIAGDTWHNPAQIEVPMWCHRADMDKPAAIRSRTQLAQDAYGHGWMVTAGHFTEANAFGHIVARPGGYAFVPIID